ncbi:MAG TPA: radical SAM protein, partial [Jatrophihabitans sp.]|nr:radical SAM protein [Jatrophihabitans sp.]
MLDRGEEWAPMKVSLVSSLHLDHSAMTMDHRAGDPIPLQSFVPMGLLCLKAYAEAHGVPAGIRVTDVNGLINAGGVANDEQFFARLAGAIKQPDDRLVGLMTDADSLHHTVVLAAELKRQDPQALICLGGPGSSPLAHDLLERFGCIDYVVRGEGEQTFAQLLEHLDADRPPTEVAGLSWRSATGAVLDNPARPVIRALDELPIPDLAAAGVTADSAVYLDVGRGCPFSCHFCATAPFWDRRYRMKSIDRILRELSLWHAAGRRHVTFSHDIFTCNRVWTRQFCERVVEAAPGVTWSCSTRTDTIDEELLELMAAAGCAEIYYGIETGSAAMQSTIHKNLDIERCRRIVAKTAAVGIRPVTGFIMGYPTETRETLADTLGRFFEFLEIGGHRAHLFTLCPFAEAPMYRDGHPIDRPAGYFEPPLLPSELAKAVEVASAHPDVFASLRRFAAPALPAQLIDASEEISSRLVVLKAIWPRLLPHYRDAFDWYERWVGWIGERNRVRRPGTRLPYTGEVDDVLDF